MADPAVLPFWGVLTAVEAPVQYADLAWTVTWHILDAGERDQFDLRVERLPQALRRAGAMKIRIAMALVAINGRRVTFHGEDADDEFMRRIAWLDRHPEPFVDAVYASYMQAERQPAVRYAAASADPNSAPPEAVPSGASSGTVGTSPDAGLPPTSGPTPRSTGNSTRKSARPSATRIR